MPKVLLRAPSRVDGAGYVHHNWGIYYELAIFIAPTIYLLRICQLHVCSPTYRSPEIPHHMLLLELPI